jgi:outer membrane protease
MLYRKIKAIRIKVQTAVVVKSSVSWDITPCSLVSSSGYTALYPRI